MEISGKAIAAETLKKLKSEVGKLKKRKVNPHLAAIVVGSDAATLSYIAQKVKTGKKIGVKVSIHPFKTTPLYQQIAEYVAKLNQDPLVHGIIIQRPLPPTLSAQALTKILHPAKDVDAFSTKTIHVQPLGIAIFKILSYVYYKQLRKNKVPHDDFPPALINWLKGKNIVLIGRGETGGEPIAQTMTTHRLNFIVLNSQIENKTEYLQNADIVISAVGKPDILTAAQLKPGAVVLGVGMYKTKNGTFAGDYDPKDIARVATFYTPITGGVGPVNVAALMQNLVTATKTLKKR